MQYNKYDLEKPLLRYCNAEYYVSLYVPVRYHYASNRIKNKLWKYEGERSLFYFSSNKSII